MRVIAYSNGIRLLKRLSGKLGLTESARNPEPSKTVSMAAAAGSGGGFPFAELSQSVAAAQMRPAEIAEVAGEASQNGSANGVNHGIDHAVVSGGNAAAQIGASNGSANGANGSMNHQALSKLLNVMDEPTPAAPLVREICEDLRGLLEILEPAQTSDKPQGLESPERQGPVAVPREGSVREITSKRVEEFYPALSGKMVGLVGFPSAEYLQAKSLFQRQRSQCVAAGDALDALSVEAASCDLLVASAPSMWDLVEPLRPEFLVHATKPVLITGQPKLLSRLAQIAQSGPREYLAFPWREEELAWRAAMLVGRPQGGAKTGDAMPKRERPEILIADEDVTTRTLLSSMLQKHGMICHLAENGTEAVDLLQTRRPCAAILEIVMPGMDGFQVLAAVKQDPGLYRTPVMLLTARCGEVDKLQAFALGADDYLTKPFSPMELAVRLKRLLKRSS